MENNIEAPQKIKNGTTIWFSNNSKKYIQESKISTWKDICTMFMWHYLQQSHVDLIQVFNKSCMYKEDV